MKPLAAPSPPPPPLSFADCDGGWDGNNNSRPILQTLVQVHDQRKGWLFVYWLSKTLNFVLLFYFFMWQAFFFYCNGISVKNLSLNFYLFFIISFILPPCKARLMSSCGSEINPIKNDPQKVVNSLFKCLYMQKNMHSIYKSAKAKKKINHCQCRKLSTHFF